MGASPLHVLSEQAIAQAASVSVPTWRKHRLAGAPVPTSRENLDEWLASYKEWRTANGQVPSTQRRTVDDETTRWQRERMKWLAIEKKWAVAHMAKQLVPRKDVIERTTQQIMAVRTALNDMVRKLASRLFNAPTPEAIEAELQAEVDHILDGFSRGLGQIIDDAGASSTLAEVTNQSMSDDADE